LNIYRTCLLIAVLLIFSGCTEAANTSVEISPTFTSEGLEMQGIEGKIGILGPEFVAGKPNKHMWHFWGTKEELSGNFRVEAVNTKTGEKLTLSRWIILLLLEVQITARMVMYRLPWNCPSLGFGY